MIEPAYQRDNVVLYQGDCLEVLPTLPDASVDAVVTDPPYGLEFMGKDWDAPWKFGFAEFGMDDTKGRKAAPVFGSKRNPMCRACRKHKRGSVRHQFCQCETPDFDETPADFARAFGDWCAGWAAAVLRVLKPGGYFLAFGGTRTYHRMTCAIEDAGFEIRDCILWLYGTGFPKGKGCLKPAYEPIVLARKPGAKVLPLGIDECRVEYLSGSDKASATPQGRCTAKSGALAGKVQHDGERSEFARPEQLGRWPANVTHDGSEEVLEAFAAFGPTSTTGKRSERSRNATVEGTAWGVSNHKSVEYAHEPPGTAARFFYCAKASKIERGPGNNHPTVKPLSLIRWLTRLACPPNGTILDPFLGSGTGALAARAEGRQFIGIERESPYLEIARNRLGDAKVDPPEDETPLYADAS